MCRRVLIIMVLLMLFANMGTLALDDMEENQHYDVIKFIAPYMTENKEELVTRGNCIATIMRLIGVDQDLADRYNKYSNYNNPVFNDLGCDDVNDGYIIAAKFAGVAVGVNLNMQGIGYFEPNRDITIKECLTFMLRCLKDFEAVDWESIIPQAVETGLLQAEETQSLNPDEALTGCLFKTLLERLLNMNRHLYWPKEEPLGGYTKSMKIDETGSIRYIDWILEYELK